MENLASVIGNVIGLLLLVGVTVWVSVDARAIGNDSGHTPGLVDTKPKLWAVGVFLALIVFLPIYLLMRIRYKRLASERRAELALLPAVVPETAVNPENAVETAGVWPPPPLPPV